MPDASPLDAYVVGIESDDMWYEFELVIARSHEEAVALAHPDFDPARIALILAGEDEIEVERQRNSEVWTGEPRVDRTVEGMHRAGLHSPDEHQCEACEEWSEGVCEECYLCSGCAAGEPDHECDMCGEKGEVA